MHLDCILEINTLILDFGRVFWQFFWGIFTGLFRKISGYSEIIICWFSCLQITPSLAKVLLHAHEWAIQDIIVKYRGDSCKLLVMSKIKPPHPPESVASRHLRHQVCPVCVASQSSDMFSSLACGHLFCKDCWTMHFEVQITQGISTGEHS